MFEIGIIGYERTEAACQGFGSFYCYLPDYDWPNADLSADVALDNADWNVASLVLIADCSVL